MITKQERTDMNRLTEAEAEELRAKRTLLITGSMEGAFDNAIRVIGGLILQGAPDMKVIIQSSGGGVDESLDVFDLIKTYPGKTTGIVIQRVESMAAIVLQACDKRLAAENSMLLIHHVSRKNVSLDVLSSPGMLREVRQQMVRSQKKLYAVLVERTHKTLAEIKHVCRQNKSISAAEAKSFGLIDNVLTRTDMAELFNPAFLEVLKKTPDAEK